MAITASSEAMNPSPSGTSLSGLDGVNLFLAGIQSGFGPFVAVLLADEKWSRLNIGFVLSAGSLAGLLSQLPGGELLDVIRSKRFLVALGGITVAVSALVIAVRPSLPVVFAALVLQGITGGFLGPAIAAISLGLVGHSALAERLGRNQRFASTGVMAATGLMGAIGYFLSYRAIFFASAVLVLPLLVALTRIRPTDIHFGRACGQPDHTSPTFDNSSMGHGTTNKANETCTGDRPTSVVLTVSIGTIRKWKQPNSSSRRDSVGTDVSIGTIW